jgi:superfamily I DNA/RNA helicase
MTAHTSSGLEFENVIVDLWESLPVQRSIDLDGDPDPVAYVALSRAMERLYVLVDAQWRGTFDETYWRIFDG